MRPIRVVLIEDNPGDARWFRMTLAECPFDTVLTVYPDGVAAVAALHTAAEADLLAVDWYLPRLEPRELLDALQAIPALAHTPIAVFVPEHEQARLLREWQGGRLHRVTKPIDAGQLTAILTSLGGASSATAGSTGSPR